MNYHIARPILASALVLAGAAAYSQGLYWESTHSGSMMQEKNSISQQYYMPGKFKVVSADNGETIVLRLDKEIIYTIDPNDKTYSEMTFAEMEASMKKAGARMDAHMAELQKQLESMPEEQRKMMEQMMVDKMPGMKKEGKVEVKKTSDKKTISGYACVKSVITEDGKELMTVWATKDMKDFNVIRKDMEEFGRRMAAMNPMMPKGFLEAMAKIEGFPIETSMGTTMKQVVTKVERRSTPAGEFEVPAGYKKVDPKLMQMDEEME